MIYETLSSEAQEEMLRQRLAQLEQSHFSHQLVIDQLKATGSTAEEDLRDIEASEKAQQVLDAAWDEVKRKLDGTTKTRKTKK